MKAGSSSWVFAWIWGLAVLPGRVGTEGLQAGGRPPSLSRLALEARSGDRKRRLAAWDALLGRGREGKKLLARVLGEAERALRERLRALLSSRAFARARSGLAAELEKRRAAALAWIFDPASFKKGYGIKEMLVRVGRVREIWNAPQVYLGKKVEGLAELLERAGEVDRYAGLAGVKPPAALVKEFSARIRKAAALEEAGVGKAQARWNREVTAWNERDAPTSADGGEMLVMRLTNEYRIMMGMRALEVDERIVRAARKHSEEMEEMNYFSHVSPVKAHAGFAQRLRLEGYPGPLAENIALARDGKRAFHAWFLSAGHHRNMLLRKATAIGVGRSRGKGGMIRWTMNLGAGDSLRGRTFKDPSLLYLQKKRRIPGGDAKAHLALARWCLSKKLIREMCEQCRAALRIDPRLEEARRLLARRFEFMKK